MVIFLARTSAVMPNKKSHLRSRSKSWTNYLTKAYSRKNRKFS